MAEATATSSPSTASRPGYFADVPILNGVDVRPSARGEMVTIVGPNGAGKSTLVQGRDRAAATVGGDESACDGEDVTGRKPHAIVARGVGYVAQRDNVFATMSVEENLELGALALRAGDGASRRPRCSSSFRDSRSGAASRRERSPAASGRCSRSRAR